MDRLHDPARHDFASDNYAGVHPEVLAALAAANDGHVPGYGADPYTEHLQDVLRGHFGADATGYPVFNGTGANVVALQTMLPRWGAVICAETAHINTDENAAPERVGGLKLLTVPTPDGKLTPELVDRHAHGFGDQHRAQPGVVSITQATELGTVYSVDEMRAIADATHDLGMLLHVDGARLSNAAAALGLSLREITTDVGVDAVSFGGTKNGLLFGDAVVFLRPELADGFVFVRKQLAQLASKMRFVAAQFDALLGGDLWLRNASHANEMASRLAAGVESLDAVTIAHPVQANAVFARLPRAAIDSLLSDWPYEQPFYVWDEAADVVRWMCGWDTT
ncbi:MAG: low specificity L-threonine aldolase, partial [Cellulomonas sp.]